MSSTNHTTNYDLPQWEATDAFCRADFNDAFDKIDTAINGAGLQFAFGTYTGDDAASKTIPLDFTPKLVFLYMPGQPLSVNNDGSHFLYGGFATADQPIYQDPRITFTQTPCESTVAMELTNHGFIVHSNYMPVQFSNHYFYSYLNNNGLTYCYFAIG